MQKQNIIKFDNVTFSYSGGKILFKNLSMELKEGTFYLLKGSSGSGKSTLFQIDDQTGGTRGG